MKRVLVTIALTTVMSAAGVCSANCESSKCYVQEVRFVPYADALLQARLQEFGNTDCKYLRFVEGENNMTKEMMTAMHGLLLSAYASGLRIEYERTTKDGDICIGKSFKIKK